MEKKKKKKSDRQKNIVREKMRTICPLYTTYARGIKIGMSSVTILIGIFRVNISNRGTYQ